MHKKLLSFSLFSYFLSFSAQATQNQQTQTSNFSYVIHTHVFDELANKNRFGDLWQKVENIEDLYYREKHALIRWLNTKAKEGAGWAQFMWIAALYKTNQLFYTEELHQIEQQFNTPEVCIC